MKAIVHIDGELRAIDAKLIEVTVNGVTTSITLDDELQVTVTDSLCRLVTETQVMAMANVASVRVGDNVSVYGAEYNSLLR